jgi:hypothetical protein
MFRCERVIMSINYKLGKNNKDKKNVRIEIKESNKLL